MLRDPILDRRTFLRRSLGALGGAAPLMAAGAALADEARTRRLDYGRFKMGIQSYSLRGFPLEQALAHTRNLGLHYWEAYSEHVPLTTEPQRVAELQGKLRSAEVRLLAHGVTGFGTDRAANERVFEAARALGVTTISADPSRESLDHLEELVERFKINIAIHNHGPGSRYDKLEQVVGAVRGRHERIGACVDTGHFLRSGENPVHAIETLGGRVYGCHLKDVKDGKVFTILGKGDLDLVGVLKALRASGFDQVLALEYEENPQNPIPDILECLAAVREAAQKI